jgi:hypothetical protein
MDPIRSIVGRRIRLLLLAALLSTVVAASAAALPAEPGAKRQTPASSLGLKTAVTGTVLLDPATPVCKVGQSCTRPLGAFKLDFSRRRVRVARVQTDSDGRYRVRLPAGIYRVTTPAHQRVGRGLEPRRIYVPAGRQAIRNFTYDAGIR